VGGVTRRQDPPRDGEGDRRPKAGGGGGGETLRRPAVYAARKLRRTMSLPEVVLWQRLRGSPEGVAFRKQHPIGPYVADFYCSKAQLVIELDSVAHGRGDRPQRDEARDLFLKDNGYRVLRIAAAEVLKDPDSVAASIVASAASPLHQPSAGPPPRPGEDLR
jgi:very-short-patch-repair endonuclease